MEYFSIGSGSSGNCAYIGTDNTKILLDAGISGKRVQNALENSNIDTFDLDGVFITHEHRDHISCLGVLARRYNIPIYATKKTLDKIINNIDLGEIDNSLFFEIENNSSFTIKDMTINTIPISHDAIDPVGYSFESNGKRLGIVTDLGCYDDSLISFLSGIDSIVIESNHDLRMLETGIYPYPLKKRIAGDYGHISNETCGELLSKLLHDNLNWIVLAHLSQENNYEQLALESVKLEINISDTKYRASDFPIYTAPRLVKGNTLLV